MNPRYPSLVKLFFFPVNSKPSHPSPERKRGGDVERNLRRLQKALACPRKSSLDRRSRCVLTCKIQVRAACGTTGKSPKPPARACITIPVTEIVVRGLGERDTRSSAFVAYEIRVVSTCTRAGGEVLRECGGKPPVGVGTGSSDVLSGDIESLTQKSSLTYHTRQSDNPTPEVMGGGFYRHPASLINRTCKSCGLSVSIRQPK
jgi:hypothetical protein